MYKQHKPVTAHMLHQYPSYHSTITETATAPWCNVFANVRDYGNSPPPSMLPPSNPKLQKSASTVYAAHITGCIFDFLMSKIGVSILGQHVQEKVKEHIDTPENGGKK